MDLGYKLKKIRESKRLSQQEIADSLGICQKTYSNYESCKTTPSVKQLSKLSKILDFNFIDIINHDRDFIDIETKPYERQTFSVYEDLIKNKDEIIKLLQEKISWLQEKKH